MKAKIKSTGEIINIAEYDRVVLDKCDSRGTPVKISYEDIELLQEKSDNIDWEQRRYEIVKDILVRIITHEDAFIRNDWFRMKSQYIRDTIEDADAIIKELKK